MSKNLLLVVASTFLTLGAFEAVIRLGLAPFPGFIPSEGWWMERFHLKRRASEPQPFVALDPDLGWVVAANLDDFEHRHVRMSTNSVHMRGKREVPLERTSDARIVVVGDSYTFGECANDEETFPAVIEQSLADTEVLNLGVMGYGQDQSVLRMRRDGLPYRPDVVLLGFHGTDMRRNLLRFRDYAKPRFRLSENGLRLENVPVPPVSHYSRQIWPPRLWNYVRMFRDERLWPERQSELHELSVAIVREMVREATKAGARPAVVVLPSPGHLKPKRAPIPWPPLAELCEESPELICLSPIQRIRELLPREEDRQPHFSCHYSPLLYRVVGEVVADGLRRELPGLFP